MGDSLENCSGVRGVLPTDVSAGGWNPGRSLARFAVSLVIAVLTVMSGGQLISGLFLPPPAAHAQTGGAAGAEAGAAVGSFLKSVGLGPKDLIDISKDVSSELVDQCTDEDGDDKAADCVMDKIGDVDDIKKCMDDSKGDGSPQDKLKECVKKAYDKKKDDDEDDDDSSNEKQGQPELSFYAMSSALTSFYVNSLVPGGVDDLNSSSSSSGDDSDDDEDSDSDNSSSDTGSDTDEQAKGLEAWKGILGANHGATAGGFLGRPDQKQLENSKWLLGEGDSMNDARFDYRAFVRDSDDSPDAGVGQYALYGATLNGLGLDKTDTQANVAGPARMVSGSALLLAYIGAGAIDTVFDTTLNVLQFLNPFNWLYKAVNDGGDAVGQKNMGKFTAGMRGGDNDNSAMDNLKDFIAKLYQFCIYLGWYVTIPIMVGLIFMMWAFSTKTDHARRFKGLAIRMGFLGLGIPLIGVTYTGALHSMQGASGDANSANSTRVVLSTFVDFENWAKSSRLAPLDHADSNLVWDAKNNAPSDSAQGSVRQQARNINANLTDHTDSWGSGRDNQSFARDQSVDSRYFSDVANPESSSGGSNSDKGAVKATVDLLTRYIKGETVSAGDYESRAKSELSHKAANMPEDQQKIVGSWVKDFNSADKIKNLSDEDVENLANPLIQVADKAGFRVKNANNSSEYQFIAGESSDKGCGAEKILTGDRLDGVAHGRVELKGNEQDKQHLSVCNMSLLSMYNYLNTDFGSTSATTYSPTGTVNNDSRVAHQSVSIVGSGAMSLVYWFSAMTLLVSFVLIGVAYCLALFINVLKRGIQVLVATPFAALGFIAGMSKVVVYTIGMFLEIFGTLVLYKIVQEFLIMIPTLIEEPLVGSMGSNSRSGSGFGATVKSLFTLGGGGGSLITVAAVTIVVSIIVILFTIMALKFRESMISAIDEAATRVVNKFMDTGVSSSSSHGSGPGAIRQGMARGAGMAATHAVMGRGGNGGSGGNDGHSGDGSPSPHGVGRATAASSDGRGNGLAAAAGSAGAGGLMASAMGQADDGQVGDINGDDPVDYDSAGYDPADASFDPDGSQLDSDADATIDIPDGGASVDSAGDLTDVNGQPMVDADGEPMNVNDLVPTDDDGRVLDADGNVAMDADGNTYGIDDVGGVDRYGNIVDNDGAIMTGADGGALSVQSLDPNAAEAMGGSTTQSMSSLSDDYQLAQAVEAQGGLSDIPDDGGLRNVAASSDAASPVEAGFGGAAGAMAAGSAVTGMSADGDAASLASDGSAVAGGDDGVRGVAAAEGGMPAKQLGELSTGGFGGSDAGVSGEGAPVSPGMESGSGVSGGVRGVAAAAADGGARRLGEAVGGDASTGAAAVNAVHNIENAAGAMHSGGAGVPNDGNLGAVARAMNQFGGGNAGQVPAHGGSIPVSGASGAVPSGQVPMQSPDIAQASHSVSPVADQSRGGNISAGRMAAAGLAGAAASRMVTNNISKAGDTRMTSHESTGGRSNGGSARGAAAASPRPGRGVKPTANRAELRRRKTRRGSSGLSREALVAAASTGQTAEQPQSSSQSGRRDDRSSERRRGSGVRNQAGRRIRMRKKNSPSSRATGFGGDDNVSR